MGVQFALNIFDAINLQTITFVNIAFILFWVVEGFLVTLIVYNLVRYRYLGNKLFYFIVSLLVCFLFCYYINISFKPDSAVQNPEKLYKEKKLLILLLLFIILFTILLFINIPILNKLLDKNLIMI